MERQHCLVGPEQLRARLRPAHVSRLVAKGRLPSLSQGVYAIGHRRLSVKGQWMAAVLACGDGAALSHAHAPALGDLRTTRRD